MGVIPSNALIEMSVNKFVKQNKKKLHMNIRLPFKKYFQYLTKYYLAFFVLAWPCQLRCSISLSSTAFLNWFNPICILTSDIQKVTAPLTTKSKFFSVFDLDYFNTNMLRIKPVFLIFLQVKAFSCSQFW